MRLLHSMFYFISLICFQKLFAQQPIINSVLPDAGAIGTVVVITGENLKDSTVIKIDSVKALIVSNTSKRLVAMIMPGSVSGRIKVSTHNGIDSSKSFSITSSRPPAAQIQDKLTGTGQIFDAQVGFSSAISADKNVIALGGAADSTGKGAVWIYTRDVNGKWVQHGNKLVPIDASEQAQVGFRLALSADGSTIITGAILDSESTGAAWIFVKDSSGNWVQQGKKLVGSNAIGPARQGFSVDISADGNTAVIGGYADSATSTTNGVGAIWVFTRDLNNIWTQQGNKLIGSGADGSAAQGTSVAISADGNTIITGGIDDNNAVGAAWIFTKDSANEWKQQGDKLSRAEDDGHAALFGYSVALNANGNTAVIGTADDHNVFGGAWVFSLNKNGIWEQQGNKLVAIDTAYTGGLTSEGRSVDISADGNTVISGGYGNNGGQGGAWVFTRDNSTWSQYGYKLLGKDVTGEYAHQGYSVSISADGNVGLVGGPVDSYGSGAGWIFADSSFILPVTIEKFRAYRFGKGVQTEWKTNAEINMNEYIIEKSFDGIHFTQGETIKAKKNSDENNYNWFDVKPKEGNNFYRLKSIDNDGKSRYSAVVKITIGQTIKSIAVSPNPVINKTFYLQLNNLEKSNYMLTLYNNLGQQVYLTMLNHTEGSEALRVNIRNIPSGIYYIQLTNGKSKYQVQVFMR